MTPPTQKPFEPTPERVEETASKMLDYCLNSAGAWQLVMEFTQKEYRKLAQWHLAETEKLRGDLAACKASHEIWERDCLALCKELGVAEDLNCPEGMANAASEAISTLCSQVEALKAQVVVKDEALKMFADKTRWCGLRPTYRFRFESAECDIPKKFPWTVAKQALTQLEAK